MKPEARRDFNKGSREWDADPFRVNLANDVADAMIRELDLSYDMAALDFGCGTGLITLRLQPLVKTIMGADSSPGMLAVLEEKIRTQGLRNVRTALVDFEKGERIEEQFHLIVCSMALHHVPDTAALFNLWFELLLPGGQLCLADLDAEDGSFHHDNTGVFHFGFNRSHVREMLERAGFSAVRDVTAATVARKIKEGGERLFSLFLMAAKK